MLDLAFWPLGNVMNKIFTLIFMIKSPVQKSQQRYVGNAQKFLVFFSSSFVRASSADVNFYSFN